MSLKKYGICFLFLMFSFVGCACGNRAEQESLEPADFSEEESVSDMFSARDLDPSFDETTAIPIRLTGTTAQCDNDSVRIDGTTITITGESLL